MQIHMQTEIMSAARIMVNVIEVSSCRMSDISRTCATGRQIITNAHSNTIMWVINAKIKRIQSETNIQKCSVAVLLWRFLFCGFSDSSQLRSRTAGTLQLKIPIYGSVARMKFTPHCDRDSNEMSSMIMNEPRNMRPQAFVHGLPVNKASFMAAGRVPIMKKS